MSILKSNWLNKRLMYMQHFNNVAVFIFYFYIFFRFAKFKFINKSQILIIWEKYYDRVIFNNICYLLDNTINSIRLYMYIQK